MSYILRQIEDYCTEVQTYWYNEIDNSSYTNTDDLKAEIDTHCQELQDAYQSYKNGLDRTRLSSLIIALFSYVVHKDVTVFNDENIPPVQDVEMYIPNYYHNWNYTLPDVSMLFELVADDADPTLGKIKTSPDSPPLPGSELDTPPIFDALKNVIENEFAPYDNEFVPKQAKILASAYSDRVLYRMFKNPQQQVTNVDIKTKINSDYGLQDIKDEFGWTWPGLDD